MDVTKPCEFIGFADIHGHRPYEFIWLWGDYCSHGKVSCTPPVDLRDPAVAFGVCILGLHSAELKGPGKLLRIRPEIFDFEPEFGLKVSQPGTVPTNRHTTNPNESGPISACFDDDPTIRKFVTERKLSRQAHASPTQPRPGQ